MSIYDYVLARIVNPSRVSSFGIELIHEFEGFRKKAYPDPGSGGRPYTIGYGTTVYKGAPVTPGMTISRQEAAEAFEEDLRRFERAVKRAVNVPILQNQFDALVSFTYNVGIDAFKRSTLLRKLNLKDCYGAADELLRWDKASGFVMAGLTRRRRIEREHFVGDLI
jgi:lysozyme